MPRRCITSATVDLLVIESSFIVAVPMWPMYSSFPVAERLISTNVKYGQR
jgi:hypothetical protein